MAAAQQAIPNVVNRIVIEGIDQIINRIRVAIGNDTEYNNKINNTFRQKIPDILGLVENIINSTRINDNVEQHASIQYENGEYVKKGIDYDIIGSNNIGENLNSRYNGEEIQEDQYQNADTVNVVNINNRLLNCRTLEHLYLKKHHELIKTFAFTLNLFDKYKYATKLLLFIIKHITDKQCSEQLKGDRSELPPILPTDNNKLVGVKINNFMRIWYYNPEDTDHPDHNKYQYYQDPDSGENRNIILIDTNIEIPGANNRREENKSSIASVRLPKTIIKNIPSSSSRNNKSNE